MKNKNDYLLCKHFSKSNSFHKYSDEQFEQIMTFAKWLEFKKSKIIFINVCN